MKRGGRLQRPLLTESEEMDWISIVFWLSGTLIVVLGPIVLIHELGHFIFAKLAGIRVEEFGFGFPPRLLKLRRGKGYLEIGTTRVIIPAGFRLPAELETGSWVDATARRREDDTYVLERLAVLNPAADDLSPKLERTDEGMCVRGELAALERGTLYSLNWLPMGAFVRMTGEEDPSDPRSLAAQPKRWRLAVMAAGPIFNIIAALMLLVGAYTTGLPEKWLVQVTDVIPQTAAAEAGLQPRDIILTVDGERIEEGTLHLNRIIRASPEQTVQLTILREDERLTLAATPELCEDAERCTVGSGFLGIWMDSWPDRTSLHQYRLPEALRSSVTDFAAIITMIVQLPARLLQGDITPQEARPASIVGASEILAFSLQQSIHWKLAFPVLQSASFVSLALGLTNLLPLPALDGGRILFVLIEAVRRRRISPEREAVVHFVGLMVLVALMAFMMFYDIFNPIIPWSWLK
jgi:regulator of sigma E protease